MIIRWSSSQSVTSRVRNVNVTTSYYFSSFAAILIVVAIGVALGVFVGGLLLSLAIYYLKR